MNDIVERLRIIGNAMSWQKTNTAQAKSAAPQILEAADEIDRLRKELVADAKRYRWFREVLPNVIFDSIAKTIELRTTLTLRDWDWNGEQLDDAIDAALAKLGADKTGDGS